ncbi:MAG: hypothetical protein KIS70_10235 [Xanthobacteraceae bacterium]|nr:hypothetical protein [Xanthobacteraceae bacterium]
MGGLKRVDRILRAQRALRRAEREHMLHLVGDEVAMDTPDSAMIAVSSRDRRTVVPDDLQ